MNIDNRRLRQIRMEKRVYTDQLSKAKTPHDKQIYQGKIASLDSPIKTDEETTLLECLPDDYFMTPETECFQKDLMVHLKSLIKMLKDNEQTVIIKRYGLDGKEPMKLSEIGSLMGYSKERIRQLENRALAQLKKDINYSNFYASSVA